MEYSRTELHDMPGVTRRTPHELTHAKDMHAQHARTHIECEQGACHRSAGSDYWGAVQSAIRLLIHRNTGWLCAGATFPNKMVRARDASWPPPSAFAVGPAGLSV